MNRLKMLFAFAIGLMISATDVPAQDGFDLRAMSAQMKKNQEEIRLYAWDSKIVYSVDGVPKQTDTYSSRYNVNGFLEKLQTGSTVTKEKVRFPDGKKLSKKDREAAIEFIRKAREQLDVYLGPLFAEKAVSSATATAKDEEILLNAKDVVNAGDTVQVTLVRSSQRPLSMSVATSNEGQPLTLDVTFGSMDYGPNYVARSSTVTTWKGLELRIDTENSNYRK